MFEFDWGLTAHTLNTAVAFCRSPPSVLGLDKFPTAETVRTNPNKPKPLLDVPIVNSVSMCQLGEGQLASSWEALLSKGQRVSMAVREIKKGDFCFLLHLSIYVFIEGTLVGPQKQNRIFISPQREAVAQSQNPTGYLQRTELYFLFCQRKNKLPLIRAGEQHPV